MKVTVERAMPSHILDVYALFKKAVKEGVYPEALSEQNVKDYYFTLCDPRNGELVNPWHFFFLAKRGRAYYGYLHAYIIAKPKSNKTCMFVEMIYVDSKKRKLGVAKQLLDHLVEESKRIGVSNFEFLCKDELVDYWSKKRKAVKVTNIMRVDL